jgi:hypothetical protein
MLSSAFICIESCYTAYSEVYVAARDRRFRCGSRGHTNADIATAMAMRLVSIIVPNGLRVIRLRLVSQSRLAE